MADPNQKFYAFGELNPVEPNFTQKKLNHTTMDPIRAMREAAIGQFTPNSIEGTGPYKGIVLQVLEDAPLGGPQPPGDWLSSFFNLAGDVQPEVPVLKKYKIRIPEIHCMLPVPSQYIMSPGETGDHVKIINKYPTFVAKDTNVSLEHPANPGDLVWVDFGNRTNQTDPLYLGMVFPPPRQPGGVNSSLNPHNSPCGNLSGGRSGGGSLSPDQRSALSSSGAHFGSPLYLPYKEISKRNKQSPSYHVKNNRKWLGRVDKQTEWIAAGGHKQAISGRLAPGSCASVQNRCARILLAQRIVAEDNADRGYMLGGKSVDAGIGGIDCSGFVQTVRAGAEYLCSADGNYFGMPNRSDGKKWHQAQAYSAWQYTSGQHKNIMGSQAKIYDGTVPVMPGDEICMARKGGGVADFAAGRSWRVNGQKYHHGVSHVGIVITDPDGHLRFAESGGKHSGVGSMRFEEWWDLTGKRKNLYIWQCKEMDAAWDSVGGRPKEPWTPELAKKLVPEIFDKNLNARATGTQETTNPATDNATSTRTTENKTEEEKAAEAAATTEGKSEEEKKRIEEAKAKLPKLEEELKALEESKGKDSQEYKDKKKEYDETKAIAEGKASNTQASQGTGQTASNTSPSPAACSAGGSGQVGGGVGGPTTANGTVGRPYTSKPPKVSDVRDATACPKYSDMYLGSVDQNTSKRRGFDFIAIHDGGQWGSSKDDTACKRLVNMFQKKKGSYNYFIGSDGTIYQLISEKLAPWASGCFKQKYKTWKGVNQATCAFVKANPRSIAITLRNCLGVTGGARRHTVAQAEAVKCLLKDISRRRGIPLDDSHVVAHHEIQKLNHYDPSRHPKKGKTTDFEWKKLPNITYDHAEENYGSDFPHKVTG